MNEFGKEANRSRPPSKPRTSGKNKKPLRRARKVYHAYLDGKKL